MSAQGPGGREAGRRGRGARAGAPSAAEGAGVAPALAARSARRALRPAPVTEPSHTRVGMYVLFKTCSAEGRGRAPD